MVITNPLSAQMNVMTIYTVLSIYRSTEKCRVQVMIVCVSRYYGVYTSLRVRIAQS